MMKMMKMMTMMIMITMTCAYDHDVDGEDVNLNLLTSSNSIDVHELFFRIKQKFFATVPAMKRTVFVWFHTFSKQQRQTTGSGSNVTKAAQIFGRTSPRYGPNELLL